MMKKLLSMILALCMLCGVGCAEETVERAVPEPKAEDMVGRVKVGKFSFELPEGVVETNMRKVDNGIEIVVCDAKEGYRLFLCSIDYKPLLTPVYDVDTIARVGGDDYQLGHLFLALVILRDKNADEAGEILDEVKALKEPMEKYGERYLVVLENSEFTLTHYYNGAGFAIVGSWLTMDAEKSAFDASAKIAQSFRFHGVSEEQTTADAEAVRIASEENVAQQYIVITNSSANIRSGPGSEYGKVTTASKGDTFLMLGKEGTWYKIEVSGQIGYVAQGLCKIKE